MMFTARSPSLFENDPRWKVVSSTRRTLGPRTGILPSQALHALIVHAPEGLIDLRRSARLERQQFDSKRWSHFGNAALELLGNARVAISQERNASRLRRHLAEQLQLLDVEFGAQAYDASHVAAGMSQTLRQTRLDQCIAVQHDNGQRGGRLVQR